jgi:SAM-dependent methyltransferase
MHKKNEEYYEFKKCVSCLTVFLSNPIQESDLNNYYTDNYLPYKGAEAWGKYKLFVEKSQENLDLKRVKVVAKNRKNKKLFSILDVGCGNPSFLNAIKKNLNVNCTGIDFSDNGWKDKKNSNISLFKTSVANFNPNQKFDVITLWHYLEHDYNLKETIEKLFYCLNPKGILIIEVPDYDTVLAKRQKQFWQGWHSPRHLTLFSKEGFRKLFSSDKWSIIKHKRYGTLDAFTLWWLGKMEKENIDWSSSMEVEFWRLVFLKIISFPFFLFEKFIPMGIQIIIVEKK